MEFAREYIKQKVDAATEEQLTILLLWVDAILRD